MRDHAFETEIYEEYVILHQFSSVAQLCPTLCYSMDYSTPGFPVLHQLLELATTRIHWVGDAIQPSHLLSFTSPALNLSHIRVFSNESVLHIRWPNYQSFSFSISPSNEYSGLISSRIDFCSPRTLKSLLQHHSSKASILQHSAFFMDQLSYPYMTSGKTIALTRPIFLGKVMSLLFNMLSRWVIAFLPRSEYLLISWLQSLSAVILEPRKIKCHCFYCFPSICHEVMGPDAMIFVFWMLSFNIFTFYHFYSPLSLSSGGSLVLLCFLHKGGVICISEVIDISPSNLDSSLCFIQPALRMIYSAYKLNKQGDSVQPWDTPFPIWNQSVVPGEGNGNPLQYSCLENPMDGGAWWAAVH